MQSANQICNEPTINSESSLIASHMINTSSEDSMSTMAPTIFQIQN